MDVKNEVELVFVDLLKGDNQKPEFLAKQVRLSQRINHLRNFESVFPDVTKSVCEFQIKSKPDRDPIWYLNDKYRVINEMV